MKATVIILAAATLSLGALPASGEKGWKLEQNSDYLGAQTVLMSNKAISVAIDRYKLSMTMTKPDYRVLGVNTRTKCYYLADYDTWRQRYMRNSGMNNSADRKLDGSETIAGKRCKHYLVQSIHGRPTMQSPAGQGKRYNTEMYCTEDFKIPEQFTSLMTNVAYVPNSLGVPLRIIRHTPMGARTVIWDTKSVKPTAVPDKFEIPKGYRRVETALALFVGAGDDEMAAALTSNDGIKRKGGLDAITRGNWSPGGDDGLPPKPTKTRSGFTVSKSEDGQPTTRGQRSGEWAPGW